MRKYAIGGVITLVVGLLTYILWGFWLAFIGLSIIYLAISLGITWLTARYYELKSRRKDKDVWTRFMKYLNDNNTWFFVGVGAFAITFVIACFNFGPALLLPENSPTPEQRSTTTNFLNHLLHGKNAVEQEPPTTPLPWATGTWFWWKATGLYLILTFGYSFFAFWDEAKAAFHKRKKYLEEKRLTETTSPSTPTTPPSTTSEPEAKKHSFAGRLLVEFFAEIMAEFLVHGVARKLFPSK